MADDINWNQSGSSASSTILSALQNIVTAIAGQTQVIKANSIIYPIAVGLGGTGVAIRGATSQSSPTTKTTASLADVMAGLTGSITTKTTGTVIVLISGYGSNTNANCGYAVQIRYGPGAAPASGAALAGTAVGPFIINDIATANNRHAFSAHVLVSGLAVGTNYWLDLSFRVTGGAGTASLTETSITAFELTV